MSASKGQRVRLTLRIPSTLRRRIEAESKRSEASLNDWIVKQLEQEIKK
jgi:predicted HicB family RNase H-like nuclease